FESPSGLISIAGGKLTGYRKMAERVVDLVVKRNFDEHDLKSCLTGSISLGSSNFKSYEEVKNYRQTIYEKLKLYHLQHDADTLVSNFGKQCDQIISKLENFSGTDHEVNLAEAELKFCLESEMVVTASD